MTASRDYNIITIIRRWRWMGVQGWKVKPRLVKGFSRVRWKGWASAEVRTGRGQWFALSRQLLWLTKSSALWDSHVPNSQSYQWVYQWDHFQNHLTERLQAHLLIFLPLPSPLPLPLIPFLLLFFVFFIASPSHSSLDPFSPPTTLSLLIQRKVSYPVE